MTNREATRPAPAESLVAAIADAFDPANMTDADPAGFPTGWRDGEQLDARLRERAEIARRSRESVDISSI